VTIVATPARYTQLIDDLDAVSRDAAGLSSANLARRYEKPDNELSEMNADCVKYNKELPL
jgi:hypothetical protein